MEKQWGKNPEYTIDLCINWDLWAILFSIGWWKYEDVKDNKNFSLTIDFLCIRFYLEIWRWANEN